MVTTTHIPADILLDAHGYETLAQCPVHDDEEIVPTRIAAVDCPAPYIGWRFGCEAEFRHECDCPHCDVEWDTCEEEHLYWRMHSPAGDVWEGRGQFSFPLTAPRPEV